MKGAREGERGKYADQKNQRNRIRGRRVRESERTDELVKLGERERETKSRHINRYTVIISQRGVGREMEKKTEPNRYQNFLYGACILRS